MSQRSNTDSHGDREKSIREKNVVEAAFISQLITSLVNLSLKNSSNRHDVAGWWSDTLDTKLD